MTLAVLIVTAIFKADWLSFIYLVLSISGIYLNSLRVRFGLIFLSLSTLLYSYLCYKALFYGDFALNILATVFYAFFYFKWNKRAIDNKPKSFKLYYWLVFALIGAVIIPLYGLLLKYVGTKSPYLNSLSAFIMVVAVAFTTTRRWQQYIMWTTMNIVQIMLWATTLSKNNLDHLPIIIINVFLLGLNIYNMIAWYRTYKKINAIIENTRGRRKCRP